MFGLLVNIDGTSSIVFSYLFDIFNSLQVRINFTDCLFFLNKFNVVCFQIFFAFVADFIRIEVYFKQKIISKLFLFIFKHLIGGYYLAILLKTKQNKNK